MSPALAGGLFTTSATWGPGNSKAINYAVKKMAENVFTFCTKKNILQVFSA